MSKFTSFFKSIFQNNNNNNNNSNNDNNNITNNHNNTENNNTNNNNTLINHNKVKSFEHFLPGNIWEYIVSLLLPDALFNISFTCSFMYYHAGKESNWILALGREDVHLAGLPPAFSSFLSFWQSKRKLSWKYIRENFEIGGSQECKEGRVKCILLGDCAAGKTCLSTKIVTPHYFTNGFCVSETTTPHPTIGASFATLPVRCAIPLPSSSASSSLPSTSSSSSSLPVSSESPSASPSSALSPSGVILELWDMNGLRNFSDMMGMYLKHAKVALIVYDVTDPCTFEGVDVWRQSVVKYCNGELPILLAGLKVDLPRKVPQETAKRYAREHGLAYVEASTKKELNITLPFLFFASVALNTFPLPLLPFLNDQDGLAPEIELN
eukprot:Phypoly_transcript_10976.p1 GENE.Phypoly_transcript_10976~~Phypoly_transcript_10976.p1  ORF type:complete len:381 (+),score=88.41 Phypoly_transcript_10976:2-1144(+)